MDPRKLVLALLVPWMTCIARADAQDIVVEITEPVPNQALFDEVTLAARVVSDVPVDSVEFFVNGNSVGTVDQPPYALQVDMGSDNIGRLIEAVARSADGIARTRIHFAPITVHDAVDLALQQLYATVTDRRGQRVLDLDVDAFTLEDEKRRQDIVTLAGGDIPFTAVLLIDGSLSMSGAPLESALRGARRFVGDMAENDEAKVIIHSDRVLRSTPWSQVQSSQDGALVQALDQLPASGGSTVLDHLFLALQLLEGRQGRRVVILLSDGWDMQSTLNSDQVRAVARRSRAVVYWVRLGVAGLAQQRKERRAQNRLGNTGFQNIAVPLSNWRDRDAFEDVYEDLETIVDHSGGRIVDIPRPDAIEDAFVDVLTELREQYAVGYYPNPRRNDGSWRAVELKVKGRGLKVRTRTGYVDRE